MNRLRTILRLIEPHEYVFMLLAIIGLMVAVLIGFGVIGLAWAVLAIVLSVLAVGMYLH